MEKLANFKANKMFYEKINMKQHSSRLSYFSIWSSLICRGVPQGGLHLLPNAMSVGTINLLSAKQDQAYRQYVTEERL